jgi:hypothetical protein
MPNVITGPRSNRRVSCSTSPSNDRSESAIAINPQDPYHMVAASKKFTDPHTYAFSLIGYVSFDGGQSWKESSPLGLLFDWIGVSDPALAWDDIGNVYLFGLPFGPLSDYDLRGMVVYKSSDGGLTWSPPNHIHNVHGDDKQWAVGDTNPTSPHYGNVYGAWDSGGIGGSQLCFARTTDNGATWKGIKIGGVDQPSGTPIPGISDSGAPEINVARDGTVFIVWTDGADLIKFVKSTDGGDGFGPVVTVASGISPIPGHLPGGKFRTLTLPTACAGTGSNIVVAWADYRDGVSHIYYRRSANGGNTWLGAATGSRLLTGAVASATDQHEFHPQLMAAPAGEIGCAFYLFGPRGGGEFPPSLIDVVLAVSTDAGAGFDNRAIVTDQAWDPTVDEVWAHGDPNVTFIGEYFGFDASRLGFFPLWTDTRTGVQELFCSRLSVRPADVYIRDSSTDVGNVPSPGDHWEYVDLIVRRQPDGDTTFVNEDLLRDGITDHYVYARVTNSGPNRARSARLAVTIGNYPSLEALPGLEFRYPQDWYDGDWDTAALQSSHLYLGTGAPTDVNAGAVKIIGPVLWPAAQIPDPGVWHHPCLLAEIRTDNDDSAGGPDSIPVPAEGDKNACNYGSYFWGSNNITQRNLSYAPVAAAAFRALRFPFIAGSLWSKTRFLEIIVDKGKELAEVPMSLELEPLDRHPGAGHKSCPEGELVITEQCRLIIRADDCDLGEFIAAPGSRWRCARAGEAQPKEQVDCHGAEATDHFWRLVKQRSSVGFAIALGSRFKGTLSFSIPPGTQVSERTIVRILQRNDRRTITGGATIKFGTPGAAAAAAPVRRRRPRAKGAPRRRR